MRSIPLITHRFANRTPQNSDWAVVTSAFYADDFPFVSHFISASGLPESDSALGPTKLSLFPLLQNVSNSYHRIWLLDDDISLVGTDIGMFISLWELAFWPHAAPLLSAPHVRSKEKSYDVMNPTHWNLSDVIVFETDFIPFRALAMETSIFRWIGEFIIPEIAKNISSNWLSSFEPLLYRASKAFGALKAIKYPCAIISAGKTHVISHTLIEKSSLYTTPAAASAASFPSWVHWPVIKKDNNYIHNGEKLLIMPQFREHFVRLAMANMSNPPRLSNATLALHVTHIAKNAMKSHR